MDEPETTLKANPLATCMQALEFYADEKSYVAGRPLVQILDEHGNVTSKRRDNGELARQALKQAINECHVLKALKDEKKSIIVDPLTLRPFKAA